MGDEKKNLYINNISYAKVTLDGKEYKIDIPEGDFLASCKVPKETECRWLQINEVKFFDSNDQVTGYPR